MNEALGQLWEIRVDRIYDSVTNKLLTSTINTGN